MNWSGLPQQLERLAELLTKEAETELTANGLRAAMGTFNRAWRQDRAIRSGNGIQVPVPRNKALFPKSCVPLEAEMSFVFVLGDSIDTDLLPRQSDFQVCVRGAVSYPRGAEFDLEDHWRVDTHIFDGAAALEPHPKIHFQRGGHAQDDFAERPGFVPSDALPCNVDGCWRSLLQSPGPRIPFLPCCPIIAIDYVIGQHDGNVHQRLRNSPEYRWLIAQAQDRMWSPFFSELSRSLVFRRVWLGGMICEA
jgi:hypothetical protein